MSILNQLPKIVDKKAKRLGRGYASGKGGHTASKGMKGQKSRTGGKVPLWFEGGQLPLIKSIPMLRGKGRFKSLKKIAEVTFYDLNKVSQEKVTLDLLKEEKIIDAKCESAKIIKSGKLEKKVIIKDIKVSRGAKKEIEKMGGKVIQ